MHSSPENLKILVLFAFSLLLLAVPVAADPVSGCQTIDTEGEYQLESFTTEVSEGETCIEITSSDVTLDGDSNTLTVDDEDVDAIAVEGDVPLENITIRDLDIVYDSEVDTAGTALTFQGFYEDDRSDDYKLDNIQVNDAYKGVFFNDVHSMQILNSDITVERHGIEFHDSSNNVIEDTSISMTGGTDESPVGVYLYPGSEWNHLVVSQVTGPGIHDPTSIGVRIAGDSSEDREDMNQRNNIRGNTITNNDVGLEMLNTHNNPVLENEFDNNDVHVTLGEKLGRNRFMDNGFLDASGHIWADYDSVETLYGDDNWMGAFFTSNYWKNDVSDFCFDTTLSGTCNEHDDVDDEKWTYADGDEKTVDPNPLSLIGVDLVNVAFDDNDPSTHTSYPRTVSFIGNELDIVGIDIDDYHLEDSDGGNIETETGDGSFDTTGMDEGYYTIQHEGEAETGFEHELELLDPEGYDAVGRVGGLEDTASLEGGDLEVMDWLTLETVEHAFNIEGEDRYSEMGGPDDTDDFLYRVDLGGMEEGWITVDKDGKATGSTALSHVMHNWEVYDQELPVVNDFTVEEGHTVSGSLSENHDEAEVLLKRHDRDFTNYRLPYTFRPPELSAQVEGDSFTFNNVPEGRYSVKIADSEGFVRVAPNSFEHDIEVEGDVTESDWSPIEVSGTTTEEVNITIDGPEGDEYRYASAVEREDAEGDTISYMEPGQTSDHFDAEFTQEVLNDEVYTVLGVMMEFEDGKMQNVQVDSEEVDLTDGEPNEPYFTFTEPMAVTGKVADPDDAVIPGARVIFESETGFAMDETDQDGEYNVSLMEGEEYSATVHWEGGMNKYDVEFTPGEDYGGTEKEFQMDEGSSLEVTVEDEETGDILDAHVRLENPEVSYYDSKRTQGEEINFTGLNSGTGDDYRLVVHPEDWTYPVAENDSVTIDEDFEQVKVELSESETETAGNVSLTNGTNIDADVTFYELSTREEAESVASDSEDGYAVNITPTGYRIEVEPHEDNYAESEFYRRIPDQDEEFELNLEVSERVTVEGVVDDADGGIVVGAEVFAWSREARHSESTVTNSSGHYQLDLHSDAEYNMMVSEEGYIAEEETETFDSDENDVNFVLSGGETMSGTVKDEDGDPIGSGIISVWNDDGSFGSDEFEDGTYEITGLEDAEHEVWVRPDNRELEVNTSENVEVGEQNFTVESRGGQKIEVTVIDDAGEEVGDAEVITDMTSGRTNADGEIELERHNVGDIVIEVRKEGYEGVKREVTIRDPDGPYATNDTKEVEIVLESTTEVEVDFEVKEGGDAVSDASIVVVNTDEDLSDSGSEVTDSGGEATIENLVEGDYRIILAVDGDESYSESGKDFSEGAGENTINNFGEGTTGYDLTYEVSLQ